MKKLFVLLCAMTFGLSLVACGGGNKTTKTDETPTAAGENKAEEGAEEGGEKKSLKKNEGNRLEFSDDAEDPN